MAGECAKKGPRLRMYHVQGEGGDLQKPHFFGEGPRHVWRWVPEAAEAAVFTRFEAAEVAERVRAIGMVARIQLAEVRRRWDGALVYPAPHGSP